MARGGVRPGAGRKKGSSNIFKPTPTPATLAGPAEQPITAAPAPTDIDDPDFILALFQRGETHDPDGRPLTRERFLAAKERQAYHKAKLATTNERRGPTKPLRDYTDDELRAIIAEEIEARGGGGGVVGAPGGAPGVPDLLPAGAAPGPADTGGTSQAAG